MFYETLSLFIHYSILKFCSIFFFDLEVWRIYIHYSECSNSKYSLFIFFFKPLFSIHYSASTPRYFFSTFNEPFLAFKVSLNRKVEAIIECFLDSATPPWLQVCGFSSPDGEGSGALQISRLANVTFFLLMVSAVVVRFS